MKETCLTADLGRQDGLLHDLARPYFLDAVDDHVFALAHAGGHHDVGAEVGAGLHAPLLDLVLIGDDQPVIAGPVDLQRRLRDHQARLLLSFLDYRGYELAVDQVSLGIGDDGPHHQRVGLLIDLRIGEIPDAGMRIVLSVRESNADIDLGQPAALLAPRLADGLEVAHAHREQHIDRVLADDGRQHTACRVDEIAHGESGAADAAVDRRANVGVVEIELGLLQRRLQLHDLAFGGVERCLVLVDLALRTELTLRQVHGAVVLALSIDELGFGDGEISLGLLDRRLELRLLDLVEQVARLDVLTLAEQNFFEEALDAGAQLDLVRGLDPADELEGLAGAFC